MDFWSQIRNKRVPGNCVLRKLDARVLEDVNRQLKDQRLMVEAAVSEPAITERYTPRASRSRQK